VLNNRATIPARLNQQVEVANGFPTAAITARHFESFDPVRLADVRQQRLENLFGLGQKHASGPLSEALDCGEDPACALGPKSFEGLDRARFDRCLEVVH